MGFMKTILYLSGMKGGLFIILQFNSKHNSKQTNGKTLLEKYWVSLSGKIIRFNCQDIYHRWGSEGEDTRRVFEQVKPISNKQKNLYSNKFR